MNAKTNMLAFSIYFFCSTLLFSSCRDQNQSHLENTNAASNVDTSNQMEKLRRTSELQKILGKPVNADRAHELTKNYWNTLDIISKADSAKSVYFAKKELDDFTQIIINEGLCSQENIGFRFYFAKYRVDEPDTFLRGQQTIIIRATCNGKDIPHQLKTGTETVFVAYDFGDVCPPRCDLSKPDSTCHDGSYNINGNCNGCPPN